MDAKKKINTKPNTKTTKRHTKDTKGRRSTKDTKSKGTLTRKSPSSVDHASIVSDYAEGILSVPEIAKRYSTTPDNVGLIVNRFWKSLTNMRESRMLTSAPKDASAHFSAKNALKELASTELINQKFLSLLSDDTTALLSEPEAIYAWSYVHSGDPDESLRVAGLDVGLYKDNGADRDNRFSYSQALRYRSLYLNAKPNVVAYIKELREKRLIDADVGKAKVQSELLEQLEQLKASPSIGKQRNAILKTIELLGKTVGAFVDRVEVHEVDPSNALDHLIEMAKEAEITQIEHTESTEVPQ